MNYPTPLSPERERECLIRIKNGDRQAREELILHNLRLVAHVAKRYSASEEEQEDLHSVGTVGLIKAANTFRADFGSRFATYAIRCIDNAILSQKRFRVSRKLSEENVRKKSEAGSIRLLGLRACFVHYI